MSAVIQNDDARRMIGVQMHPARYRRAITTSRPNDNHATTAQAIDRGKHASFRVRALRQVIAPIALIAAFVACEGGSAYGDDKIMRVSLNTELQVLDPIVTTINATRVFAYMVFDELVGIDREGHYHPQMLDNWQSAMTG